MYSHILPHWNGRASARQPTPSLAARSQQFVLHGQYPFPIIQFKISCHVATSGIETTAASVDLESNAEQREPESSTASGPRPPTSYLSAHSQQPSTSAGKPQSYQLKASSRALLERRRAGKAVRATIAYSDTSDAARFHADEHRSKPVAGSAEPGQSFFRYARCLFMFPPCT